MSTQHRQTHLGLIAILLLSLGRLVVALAVPSPGAKMSKTETAVYSLQSPHPILSPSQTLRELAEACDDMGVESFDVYGDFHVNKESEMPSFLRNFEARLATEFGKDDAVFMPSGGMAQSIALLIHDERKNRNIGEGKKARKFLCHWSSHLMLHEQEGYEALCGMQPIVLPIDRKNPEAPLMHAIHEEPLQLSHLERLVEEYESTGENSSGSATSSQFRDEVSTMILELPHREVGGKCTPWNDIIAIKQLLHEHDVAFHCDGARIFEASAAYADHGVSSFAELASPFDSVYISFYKGLGGLSGAALLGSKDFCEEARVWLRRFGGNLYTLLPYVVSGMQGYERYWVAGNDESTSILSFRDKRDKLCRVIDEISQNHWFSKSEAIAFDPPIPQVNMVHCYFKPAMEECLRARDEVEKDLGIRVFHRLREVPEDQPANKKSGFRCKMELSIGEENGDIPEHIFVQGWLAFSNALFDAAESDNNVS